MANSIHDKLNKISEERKVWRKLYEEGMLNGYNEWNRGERKFDRQAEKLLKSI